MTKQLLTIGFLILGISINAQSKKEQISVLTYRIDSISNILNNERIAYQIDKSIITKKNDSLSSTIKNDRNTYLNERSFNVKKIDSLKNIISQLNSEIISFEKNVTSHKNELIDKKQNLEAQINAYNTLKLNYDKLMSQYDSLKKVGSDESSWKILKDQDIEIVIKLVSVEYGDMSTYLNFENNKKEAIVFAYWNWKCTKITIDQITDKEIGKLFKVKMKYSKIKELEYRGFEIGNVETGQLIDSWVLSDIIKLN